MSGAVGFSIYSHVSYDGSSLLNGTMQSYKYDTKPAKGKEPAINSDRPSTQPKLFPRKSTMSRPQVCEDTFDRPQHTLPASRTAEDEGPSDPRRRQYYRTSSTWTSSNADINLMSEDDGVYDPATFVVEYNRLARKVFQS